MKNMMNSKPAIAIFSVCFTLMTASVQAADLVQFSNGNIADADDVNANFNELEARIETITLTPGAVGTQGIAGTNGINGANGVAGADGPQGIQGDTGLQGIAGPAGADSMVAGPVGLQGPTGGSCTAIQGSGSATISCDDNSMASVYDGTTAIGNTVGDMQYWDGAEWVVVPSVNYRATLHMCKGVPTWSTSCTYAVGDTGPAGGIVFYVTDGGLHGLEAAPADIANNNTPIRPEWGCYNIDVPGAVGTIIGTGAQNTAAIVAAGCSPYFDPNDGIAANVAASYSLNGIEDWFLPSKDEMNELYFRRSVVGGFYGGNYWTSSQDSVNVAWYQNFGAAGQTLNVKLYDHRVRAVRAF
jgi:hypothetical protein